jgi:hypothetical protein
MLINAKRAKGRLATKANEMPGKLVLGSRKAASPKPKLGATEVRILGQWWHTWASPSGASSLRQAALLSASRC